MSSLHNLHHLLLKIGSRNQEAMITITPHKDIYDFVCFNYCCDLCNSSSLVYESNDQLIMNTVKCKNHCCILNAEFKFMHFTHKLLTCFTSNSQEKFYLSSNNECMIESESEEDSSDEEYETEM